MNMIEKVARAVCENDCANWDKIGVFGRAAYIAAAKAAIKAMCEPTDAMIDAMSDKLYAEYAPTGNPEDDQYSICNQEEAARAMIDAALEES